MPTIPFILTPYPYPYPYHPYPYHPSYKGLTTSFSDDECPTEKKKKKKKTQSSTTTTTTATSSTTATASTADGGAESWTGALTSSSPGELFYDHMRAAVYMAWGTPEADAKAASATTRSATRSTARRTAKSTARSSSSTNSGKTKSTTVVPKTFIDYLYDAKQIDTKVCGTSSVPTGSNR